MASRANGRNTSQRHGNEVEDLLKTARGFSGAANIGRTGMESFDIEDFCDPVFNLATSIKTAKGDWIGLADAERFCRIDRPYRLLALPWVQETPEIKRYDVVHEMIIPLGVTRKLIGGLTPELVLEWHNDIASFAAGPAGAAAARARADEIQAEITGKHGHVRLDFKIDDKEQRRLQFSAKLSKIAGMLAEIPDYNANGFVQPHHVVHRKLYHQFILPIRLASTPRRIERTASTAAVAAPIMFDDAPAMPSPAMVIAETTAYHGNLRRPTPIRREDKERTRRSTADVRQTALFG